jgi:hypothetical protein
MNTEPSTTRKIKEWILDGYNITPLEALEKWGCMRLAARIAELRSEGINVKTTKIKRNGKTFAQYSL